MAEKHRPDSSKGSRCLEEAISSPGLMAFRSACTIFAIKIVQDMLENFNFDLPLIFAILNGKVSLAINQMLARNFQLNGLDVTPDQWTVLLYLWREDGVSQQELCNATFKDKPSMTRLINAMERQHLVVRISDKHDRRTNLIYLTRTGKEREAQTWPIVTATLREALAGIEPERLAAAQEVMRQIFQNAQG